jgi:hypothetical protein
MTQRLMIALCHEYRDMRRLSEMSSSSHRGRIILRLSIKSIANEVPCDDSELAACHESHDCTTPVF